MVYAGAQLFSADDRALRHLQIVIEEKLRHQECFALGWVIPPELGAGHGSAWICPGIDVMFTFSGHEFEPINRTWLRALKHAADAADLRLVPEPAGTRGFHVP